MAFCDEFQITITDSFPLHPGGSLRSQSEFRNRLTVPVQVSAMRWRRSPTDTGHATRHWTRCCEIGTPGAHDLVRRQIQRREIMSTSPRVGCRQICGPLNLPSETQSWAPGVPSRSILQCPRRMSGIGRRPTPAHSRNLQPAPSDGFLELGFASVETRQV